MAIPSWAATTTGRSRRPNRGTKAVRPAPPPPAERSGKVARMLHALTVMFAAAEEEAEPSKTAFYLCGGLLAVWAVVLSVIGMTQASFPGTVAVQRGVMALSAVLVAAAMATAVITA